MFFGLDLILRNVGCYDFGSYSFKNIVCMNIKCAVNCCLPLLLFVVHHFAGFPAGLS